LANPIDARLMTCSELGIATHYVNNQYISEIHNQLSQLSTPTLPKISNIVSSFSGPAPTSDGVSSKETPDAHSPITGSIRQFLDKTFSKDSINKIYESLDKASKGEDGVSEDVKSWAEKQKSLMDMRSPTGMAVALEGYRRAKKSQRLDVTLQNGQSHT
jgi:3-hydroxyisobutyryl-CoA hydrolase